MLVEGITTTNYNTIGRQRLSNAEAQLDAAIKSGADSSVLLTLQKLVDDLKNSIEIREKQREKRLEKMSLTERRVQEAQFDEIKRKFDESNRIEAENAEKTRESIKGFSEKVGGVFDNLADNVFHTLLGPLQLIVNPLEKVFDFNLFKTGKKAVGDYLQGKFPATYENLKKNGGVIGAVGIAIVDAIRKTNKTGSGDYLTGDGSLDISSLLSGSGLSLAGILKGAGVVGLIAAAVGGTIVAWKNDWDEQGIESAQELKTLLHDENATLWEKTKGVAKYAVKIAFGSVAGGLKSGWNTIKSNFSELQDTWNDPEKSTGAKIWDSVVITVNGVRETIVNTVGGFIGTAGDYIVGFFADDNPEVIEKWNNFKSEMSAFSEELFGGIKKFFSSEEIARRWELFKEDPSAWADDIWTSVTGYTERLVTHITNAFDTHKGDWSWDEWWNTDVKTWWENSWLNPTTWFGGSKVTNTTDENENTISKELTIWERIGDWFKTSDSRWNPATWFKPVDDAIISKDNDLYIPSPDDNILVTKSNVIAQPSTSDGSDTFRQELMTVLRDIASNLKQPVVMNNLTTPVAVDFGGLRL